MKLKLMDIRQAALTLHQIKDKSFPVKMSYALSKNMSVLWAEYDLIEKEREKICNRYADKDENGKPIINGNVYAMSADNDRKCNKEFEELLETEADVDVSMIPQSVLDACDQSDRYDILTLGEMRAIGFLIQEPDKE